MALLPSAAEMRAMDESTIQSGVASLTLMERAGSALFHYITTKFAPVLEGTILILCGPGNNGGDGLVLGRMLRENGFDVEILLVKSDRYTDEVQAELKALQQAGRALNEEIKLRIFAEGDALPNFFGYSLIVDALLGVGSGSNPRGAVKSLIVGLNVEQQKFESFPAVISVDMPSGINVDTGEIYDPCIHATHTAAIEHIKRGMAQFPALSCCGEITVLSIGLLSGVRVEFSLIDRTAAAIPARLSATAHKGNFGRVLVIGGCKDMPGAPVLAAEAALRAGAGLVTLARPPGVDCPAAPELLLFHVDGASGSYNLKSLDQISSRLDSFDALVLGPGIGLEADTIAFLTKLLPILEQQHKPVVIDADALNALSSGGEGLPELTSAVLTPHPGEMARLLGVDTKAVQADRYSAARKLSRLSKSVAVLKGARTVIYHNDHGAVCPTGNPYLATAGSGDVLSGILAAFLAQGMKPYDAACKGVYLHGLCADILRSKEEVPLIASDLISVIPQAIANLGK